MKKNERLTLWLESWGQSSPGGLPREYISFVALFNAGAYYEAHDILEHLWLRCGDSNRSFFQALIQLAGAFVHFQKHLRYPEHPTHSRRLSPGARLLDLALNRLHPYGAAHWNLDLREIQRGCLLWKQQATEGINPLRDAKPPRLEGKQVAFADMPAEVLAAVLSGWQSGNEDGGGAQ